MGYNKTSNKNPGGQRRAKKSYALQLTEKQKVKFVYSMQEKQFRGYYEKASRARQHRRVLLSMMERRLDNVVYRLGFASTRREARQLVNHGHFTVNGKAGFLLPGQDRDWYPVCEKRAFPSPASKKMKEDDAFVAAPKLDRDKNTLTGKVVAAPPGKTLTLKIAEHLIVELYSSNVFCDDL